MLILWCQQLAQLTSLSDLSSNLPATPHLNFRPPFSAASGDCRQFRPPLSPSLAIQQGIQFV
ncbi:hypothetical protein Hanom_Chr06g00477281 [Helianthus anomalus]